MSSTVIHIDLSAAIVAHHAHKECEATLESKKAAYLTAVGILTEKGEDPSGLALALGQYLVAADDLHTAKLAEVTAVCVAYYNDPGLCDLVGWRAREIVALAAKIVERFAVDGPCERVERRCHGSIVGFRLVGANEIELVDYVVVQHPVS